MASFPGHIFKSYDIRGKVGSELNEDLVFDIARAFADWLPNDGPVAVGHDMRPDSAAFAESFMRGLCEQGRDVVDLGRIATDMIYFAVGKLQLAGGAVITASHDPGEYNGIKLCREEAKPVGENSGLFAVRDLVEVGSFKATQKQGVIQKHDIVEGWIEHVLSFVDTEKLKHMRIAVDAGNGMAGEIFAELEPYVPWEVTEMYFQPDGTFPNHEANPLKFETLNDIISVIKQEKIDGGIAFDGDGDRAFLIDETGTVITGGATSAMMSQYFLKLQPGATIVYDARNSRSVPEVIEENGGKPLRTKVGHSNIKAAMREYDSPFGGEASGHYYFRDNWYADSGLIAAVIGLYVATLRGKKLSELRAQFTHYEALPETNYEVSDKDAAIQAVAHAFAGAEIDWLDGVTVSFDDGSWLNVRASNTEPLLRLNVEARTKHRLDQLVSQAEEIITGF